jgi:hypothetical protein
MEDLLLKLKRTAARLEFWDWGIWFGGGIFCLVKGVADGNGFIGVLGVLLIVPGIAQLIGHRWAWLRSVWQKEWTSCVD